MGVGQGFRLALDGLHHARMAVAQATDRCAAGRVEQFTAIRADQPDAVAAGGDGRGGAQRAMQDAGLGHGAVSGPGMYWEWAASITSVWRSRAKAAGPPRAKQAAASAWACAMAPVRLGKNPGPAAASKCNR